MCQWKLPIAYYPLLNYMIVLLKYNNFSSFLTRMGIVTLCCSDVVYLGYLFGTGQEYPAIVEFAPFQKVAKRRSKKKDAKTGTIEEGSFSFTFSVTTWRSHSVSVKLNVIFVTLLMHRWRLQEILGVVQWRWWKADIYTRDSAWRDRG